MWNVWRNMRDVFSAFVGNPERKKPLPRPRYRCWMLKLMFKKYDERAWKELIWSRLVAGGGLL